MSNLYKNAEKGAHGVDPTMSPWMESRLVNLLQSATISLDDVSPDYWSENVRQAARIGLCRSSPQIPNKDQENEEYIYAQVNAQLALALEGIRVF